MTEKWLIIGLLLLGLFIFGCTQIPGLVTNSTPPPQTNCTDTTDCPKEQICIHGVCKLPPECRKLNETCANTGDCCKGLVCQEYTCIQLVCPDGTNVTDLNQCPKCPPTCTAFNFDSVLNKSKVISVVMDFRGATYNPDHAWHREDARTYTSNAISECQGQIVKWVIDANYGGVEGRTMKIFHYQDGIDGCIVMSNPPPNLYTEQQCQSMYSGAIFYIKANEESNSVSFYPSEVVIQGDAPYLNDCSQPKILGR